MSQTPLQTDTTGKMLCLNDISAGYGDRLLISGATATLGRGELVALLGANGAGKSTLLRIMSGRLAPLSGAVTVDGRDITGLSGRDMALRVALVTTDRPATGALTVSEVVAMGRYPHTGFFGRLSAADRRVVDDALDDVGMTAFARKTMATLSDGEAQKVMIARALAQDTPVILLDEPTAFLDAASRIETLDLLGRLAVTRSKAILLSTHDIAPVLRRAHRLWLVHDGRLVAGTPAAMARDADGLSALFAGRGVVFNAAIGDFE